MWLVYLIFEKVGIPSYLGFKQLHQGTDNHKVKPFQIIHAITLMLYQTGVSYVYGWLICCSNSRNTTAVS